MSNWHRIDVRSTAFPHRSTGAARDGALIKPLILGFAAILLLLAFAHLGGDVVEGDTRTFDMGLLRAAQNLRTEHPGVTSVMRDLTGLGSVTVLSLFTLASAGYLLLASARRTALILMAAVLSGTVADSLLKTFFGRSRPPPAFADYVLPSLSFPSGHASMSAIVFLTLGAMFATTRVRLAERFYVMAVAALLAVLVGISRVALGVHWATDVIGGWAVGLAWAIVWLLIALRFGATDMAAASSE